MKKKRSPKKRLSPCDALKLTADPDDTESSKNEPLVRFKPGPVKTPLVQLTITLQAKNDKEKLFAQKFLSEILQHAVVEINSAKVKGAKRQVLNSIQGQSGCLLVESHGVA